MRTVTGSPLLLLLTLAAAPNVSADNTHSFYTRYASYPPYCSTPEQVATRSIPLLDNSTNVEGLELLHVTAIMRHGARTPWGNTLNCWEDYWTNPATAVWDCNLTAYLAPPPPIRASQEGTGTPATSGEEAMFLFEKRYDALASPPIFSNKLNGTCQMGQLILQGYQQELQNGKFLRDAYVYNKPNTSNNPPSFMQLMDAQEDGTFDDIYYRVDDDERTLMSGQVVLRGLLGSELHQFFQTKGYYPVIPLHTGDRERDVVDPNHASCPRLEEIRNEATPEYQAFNTSDEANLLRKFHREVLKLPRPKEDMHAIDCLMTTICTDRPLPKEVDDYGSNESKPQDEYGTNLFQRLFEFDTQLYTLHIKANDAEYSRLGMGPLWHEILQQIKPHLEDHSSSSSGAPKLSVFAGHDTTIMPLLASIDPDLWPSKEWPPYASMVVLETYRMEGQSEYAFRLVYNGQVLTPKIDWCSEELCDMQGLLNRVGAFATLEPECDPKTPTSDAPTTSTHLDPVSQTQDILSTPEGTAYLVLIVLSSAMAGALLACLAFCLCGGSFDLWRCRRRQTSQLAPQQDTPDIPVYNDDDDPML